MTVLSMIGVKPMKFVPIKPTTSMGVLLSTFTSIAVLGATPQAEKSGNTAIPSLFPFKSRRSRSTHPSGSCTTNTSSSTHTTNPRLPDLPIELLEKIIEYTWSLPLTPSERATVLKTFPLVCSTWKAMFEGVWSRDVHIFSTWQAIWVGDVVKGRNPIMMLPSVISERCETVTLYSKSVKKVERPKPPREGMYVHPVHPMGGQSSVLTMLMGGGYLPKLKTVRVEFEDAGEVARSLRAMERVVETPGVQVRLWREREGCVLEIEFEGEGSLSEVEGLDGNIYFGLIGVIEGAFKEIGWC